MIRASGLYGRAVIDLDTAERVGEVDEIIVDPYGPGVAGYVVSCDRSMFGRRKRIIIPIDAVYSPIRNVKYSVEAARVGQRTDYDRLILEVWTNGTIRPEDAILYAARVLRDHLTLFISIEEEAVTQSMVFASRDYAEMKAARAEKRDPTYRGR